MMFEPTPEQIALGDAASRLFEKTCSPDQLRGLWATDTGRSDALWKGITDLGLPGIIVPSELDGMGGSIADLLPVLEGAGRYAVPDALIESLVLGPAALALGGNDGSVRDALDEVIAGDSRVTVSLYDGAPVPDAHVSDRLVRVRSDAVTFSSIDRDHLEPVPSTDPSRRIFRLTELAADEVVLSTRSEDVSALREMSNIASSAVLIGISEQLIAVTVEYAKVRTQFGRAIGSFQAVKHQLARAYAAVEMAKVALHGGVRDSSHASEGNSTRARYIRTCAVDAEKMANRVALHVHGGIGFTWESDLHMWLKRGKILEQSYGTVRSLAIESGRELISVSTSAVLGRPALTGMRQG